MRFQNLTLVPGLLAAVAALAGATGCTNDKTSTTQTTGATGSVNVNAPTTTDQPTSATPAKDPMASLDSDMKKVLDQLGTMGGKPIETLSATDARAQPTVTDAVLAILRKNNKATSEEVGKSEDRTITANGATLPVRIVTPKTGKGPFPVVVYFHGGGFVIATNDTYDASIRGLANGAEAIVVSPEYRKAPEHKLPAAHDDALATYEWVLKNAASFGGDPKRVAVAGESAGGNLAAAVSMAARDKKEQLPLFEVLVYPVAGGDMTKGSFVEDKDVKPLDTAMMGWFTDKYFRTPADAKDPRIALLNDEMRNMPPTLIINAQIDPLRSDGEQLAQHMKADGVTVEQKTYTGVTHEFFGTGAVVSKGKDAMSLATSRLKDALHAS